MQVIREEADLASLDADDPADAELRRLIDARVSEALEYVDRFGELVFFVAARPGDSIAEVDAALGFPVLRNRFDGVAFGDPGFTPSWDVIEEHVRWRELVFVLSDDGSGAVLFVSKEEGVPADLAEMCRQFIAQEVPR